MKPRVIVFLAASLFAHLSLGAILVEPLESAIQRMGLDSKDQERLKAWVLKAYPPKKGAELWCSFQTQDRKGYLPIKIAQERFEATLETPQSTYAKFRQVKNTYPPFQKVKQEVKDWSDVERVGLIEHGELKRARDEGRKFTTIYYSPIFLKLMKGDLNRLKIEVNRTGLATPKTRYVKKYLTAFVMDNDYTEPLYDLKSGYTYLEIFAKCESRPLVQKKRIEKTSPPVKDKKRKPHSELMQDTCDSCQPTPSPKFTEVSPMETLHQNLETLFTPEVIWHGKDKNTTVMGTLASSPETEPLRQRYAQFISDLVALKNGTQWKTFKAEIEQTTQCTVELQFEFTKSELDRSLGWVGFESRLVLNETPLTPAAPRNYSIDPFRWMEGNALESKSLNPEIFGKLISQIKTQLIVEKIRCGNHNGLISPKGSP